MIYLFKDFKIFFIFILTINIIFPQTRFGGNKFDPSFKWRSIKTKHFWVHYHQNLEKIAQRTAKLAEKIHAKLSPKIGWKPALRTDIVLVDSTDRANAYAIPIPYNKVVLFPVKPEMNTVTNNFNDWMDILITHEYTHILTLDMTYGVAGVLKYILGRFYFINTLQPLWTIEGYAVHEESQGGHGRNNSTYVDMIMRNEVADNSFDSIHDISHNFYRKWPRGNHYLYGGRFIKFLNTKYGNNSFLKVYQTQASNFWPYQASDNMEKSYKQDLDSLWLQFQAKEEKIQRNKILKIKKKPLTQYRLLSTTGFYSGLGRFDPSGKFLYFIKDANDTETRLFRYNIPQKIKSSDWFKKQEKAKSNVMSDVNFVNYLSIGQKGQVLISDLDKFNHFSNYYDLFLFSANNYNLKRLSHGLRSSYVDYNAHQKKIVFVQSQAGNYSLSLSDLNFRNTKKIIENSSTQLGFTRFSPNGKKIVFNFKDSSGFSQIVILELKTKSILKITSGHFNHLQPSWHPDGNRLLFSSDRSEGVYNLFEYNLQTQQISQLSNVVGGLFYPDISPDGKLIAATSYNSTGFNQALLPYPSQKIKVTRTRLKRTSLAMFKLENKKLSKTENLAKDSLPSQNYLPLASIAPSFWIPFFQGNFDGTSNLGFTILSSDALGLNLYGFSLNYFPNFRQIILSGNYTYSGFWPDLSLIYYTTINTSSKIFNSNTILHKITGSINLPFNYFQTKHNLNLNYALSKIKSSSNNSQSFFQNNLLWMGSPTLSYSYINYDFYLKSISPEDGRSLIVATTVWHDFYNIDMVYQPYFSYSEYIPSFFKNHVLSTHFTTSSFLKTTGDEYIYNVALQFAYSFPIWQPDIGFYKILPVFLRDMWLDLFFTVDSSVKNHENLIKAIKKTVGAQLNIKYIVMYASPLTAFLRYTYAIDNSSNSQIEYGISNNFFNISDTRIRLFQKTNALNLRDNLNYQPELP